MPLVIKWYGKEAGKRTVEVALATEVWYCAGLYCRCPYAGSRSMDLQEKFAPQALLPSGISAEPTQVDMPKVPHIQVERLTETLC